MIIFDHKDPCGKLPTYKEWSQSSSAQPGEYEIELIWLPSQYPSYTIQTYEFRYSVRRTTLIDSGMIEIANDHEKYYEAFMQISGTMNARTVIQPCDQKSVRATQVRYEKTFIAFDKDIQLSFDEMLTAHRELTRPCPLPVQSTTDNSKKSKAK